MPAIDRDNLNALIGTQYSPALIDAHDWHGYYPLVTVEPDGTVTTIDDVLGAEELSGDRYVLVTINFGRVTSAGTGYENDAAALRSELLDAGVLRPEEE